MIILALDTTAITASVALLEDEKIIAQFGVHNKLTHSEKVLPMIDEVLKNSGYTIDDVELIAVSRGPGSFTGVRIGVAIAKGLAFPKNIKIVGVSALEALAENVRCNCPWMSPCLILPSMDARRNELYNAVFEFDGRDIKRLCEDRAISCEEVETELCGEKRLVFINGDGALKLYEHLVSNDKEIKTALVPEILLSQNAISVGKVGYRKYLSGDVEDTVSITPLYLRTSQAERIKAEENKK